MTGAVLGAVAAYVVQTQAMTWLPIIKVGGTYNNHANNILAAALGAYVGFVVERAVRS